MVDQLALGSIPNQSSPSSSHQNGCSSPDAQLTTSSPDPQPSSGASNTAEGSQPPSSASNVPGRKCAHCSAVETESKSLKPCSKCQTALYCSRDCQKAGYKVHKKICAKDAQVYALKVGKLWPTVISFSSSPTTM
jgi:hypothetical protein